MKRHKFSEWVFIIAVFFALAGTVFLALAPKLNFSRPVDSEIQP